MILKHEADALIAKGGEFFRVEQKRIFVVESDGSMRRRFECADHVKQRAFAAA